MRRSKERRTDKITTDKAAIERIVADKVGAILSKKQSPRSYTDVGREAVTEEDITLLKEKHYCIVHKEPV